MALNGAVSSDPIAAASGQSTGARRAAETDAEPQTFRGADASWILAAVGDAVACFDSNGVLLWGNPAFGHLRQHWPDFRSTEERLATGARLIAMRHERPLAGARRATYYHSAEFPVPTVEFSTRAVVIPADHAGLHTRVVTVLANRSTRSYWSVLESIQRRYRLTPREREVMELLMRGLHNADISKALSISSHTARHHTESVLEKLGVRSRAAIGALLR